MKCYFDVNEQWNRRLAALLSRIREWHTPEAVELYAQLYERTPGLIVFNAYELLPILERYPQVGLNLVRIALTAVLEQAIARKERGDSSVSSADLDTLSGHGLKDALRTAAGIAPRDFIKSILPWFERTIKLTAPGRIGCSYPRLSRCRISPSKR
jgi:hypothetical protein